MDVLTNFGINLTGLIFYTINFLILVALLTKFLYKPVINMLEKRREIIAKAMQDAENVDKQKAEMEKEYRKVLRDAGNESKQIIQTAIDQSNTLRVKLHREAKEDAENILIRAREEIALERTKMYASLRDEIVHLMGEAISKVLKETLTKEEQQKILHKAMEEIHA